MVNWFRSISSFVFFFIILLKQSNGSNLTTIDGVLIQVVDNCTPGDDSTCPDGHCCVREGLAYIPEYTGPKPSYQIACKPYRQQGEFCYHPHVSSNTFEVCPCAPNLNCITDKIFGHCQ